MIPQWQRTILDDFSAYMSKPFPRQNAWTLRFLYYDDCFFECINNTIASMSRAYIIYR